MSTLKELLQQQREFEEKQPISYFINEILETIDFAKQDGFELKELSEAVYNFKNEVSVLKDAYYVFYNDNNRIKNEFEPLSGYLHCIGHYIRAIDMKLNPDQ